MMSSCSTELKYAFLRRQWRRCSGICAIALASLLSFPSAADVGVSIVDIDAAPSLGAEPEVISPAKHRADLRRALVTDFDRDVSFERRKLTQEEREALHRDLRNAMRNVNAEHDKGERRRR